MLHSISGPRLTRPFSPLTFHLCGIHGDISILLDLFFFAFHFSHSISLYLSLSLSLSLTASLFLSLCVSFSLSLYVSHLTPHFLSPYLLINSFVSPFSLSLSINVYLSVIVLSPFTLRILRLSSTSIWKEKIQTQSQSEGIRMGGRYGKR